MSDPECKLVLSTISESGRWKIDVYRLEAGYMFQADLIYIGTVAVTALFRQAWFGPYRWPGRGWTSSDLEAKVSVRSLPDNVAGLFVGDECYVMFRCGASRRRRRLCANMPPKPFTQEEIDWFCAKKHVQYRRPH